MNLPDAASEASPVIREATPDDLALIIHQRRSMFIDMGYTNPALLDAMAATSGPFIKNGLQEGFYRGWLVELGGQVVAGGGLMILGHPSSPRDPSPRRAWILNMYTEPAYRGRGLAKSIVETITAWCREQGFAWVSLHASEAGRHLYENLGFKPTNEMRLELK
jgi:GNAT superfamily N-acetyltransferase